MQSIKLTLANELYSKKKMNVLEAFINADSACSPFDRRSIMGYYTFLGGNLMV